MNPLKALRDIRTIGAILTDAERIAGRMGDAEPGAEHLLVAAVGLPDGSAARTFGAFGVSADRLERAIADEHAAGLVAAGVDVATAARLTEPAAIDPPPGRGVYRSSASARDLFAAAGAIAREAGQRFVGAHVVLAAADLEHGTAARVLDRLHVDRDALRAAARAELG